MKFTGRILPVLVLTLPSLSQADVNMKDASFLVKLTDFSIQGFSFERSYNSRSLHRGLFGFGWCTDFEKKLIFEKDKILLSDCALDQSVEVKPQKKKKLWIVLRNKETQIYNLSGQLLSLQKPHQRKQSFHYSSEGTLEKIAISPRLQFRLIPSQGAFIAKVERLQGPSPRAWEYTYEGDNWVKTKGTAPESVATYNDYHNLTELRVNAVTTKISYSDSTDEVRSVTSGSCSDNYTFIKSESLQLSKLERFCDSKLSLQRSYVFEFSKNLSGQNILSRVRVFDPQSKRWQVDATFNSKTGRNALGDIRDLEPLR
jgi:hypothetical protein